jgi:hypothetical protein
MRAILTAMILCVLVLPACAEHRYHHHHRHHHHAKGDLRHAQHGRAPTWSEETHSGLVTVQTAAGIPITVASHLASKFQALVADFVAAGYRPRHIGCHAHGGHVRNSRHYAGAACDFDQRGWGKTVAFMYSSRAHAIIVAHGFRDGRDFRDQGHVDDGGIRYARRSYGSRYGG